MQIASKLHGAESKLLFHSTKRVGSLSYKIFCCAINFILSCSIPPAPRSVEMRGNSLTTNREQKLFTPVQFGAIALKHRVVMAPLTRSRSEQPGNIPGSLMAEYYGQRASEGGFIISE